MAEAAAELPDSVIALFDAGLAPVSISRAIASIHDAVTRRMIEFTHQDLGRPPVPYTWMATGSFGRFEPFPSSDVDSAIAWEGPDDDPEIRRAISALAEHVLEGLGKCGFEPDTKGAVASSPLFARSVEEWERAAGPGSCTPIATGAAACSRWWSRPMRSGVLRRWRTTWLARSWRLPTAS